MINNDGDASCMDSVDPIPEGWATKKLPYLIERSNAGEVIDKSHWGDGEEILFTCARDPLVSSFRNFPEAKRTTERDLLLTRNGTPYIHEPPEGAIYSNVVQRISLSPSTHRRYLKYALEAAAAKLKGYGVSIESLNFSMWSNLPVVIPPPAEQEAIAAALDRGTTRIDALIEKKTRFIELLKEKRQALITQAVTKGFNPDAPMRDSGVEWIGEAPEHWTPSKLRFVARERGGKTPSKDNLRYWDGDVPWVSPKDMKVDVIAGSADRITTEAVRECGMSLLPAGTILVVVRGMILAHSFPVAETAVPVTINQDMKALTPASGVSATYFRLLLQSVKQVVVDVLVAEAAHGTRVLRTDIWKQLPILLPPSSEQLLIVEKIAAETKKVDSLVASTERSIALLTERRAALITSAVTGQIDLRESA